MSKGYKIWAYETPLIPKAAFPILDIHQGLAILGKYEPFEKIFIEQGV